MNRKTLNKLKANPHYKISPKQYSTLNEEDREPMIEIGKVASNRLPMTKHQTRSDRYRRTGINAQE